MCYYTHIGLLQLTVYKSKEDTPCLSPPPVKREKIEEEEDEKEKERKDNEQVYNILY